MHTLKFVKDLRGIMLTLNSPNYFIILLFVFFNRTYKLNVLVGIKLILLK